MIEKILRILRSAGVVIIHDPGLPTAAARIRQGRYEVVLGRAYEEATPEQRETLLRHELAHIVRGDVLTVGKPGIDPRRANLAMDAVINAALPAAHVAALHGVTYAALAAAHPDLPPITGGWRPIYEALGENNGAANHGAEPQDGGGRPKDGEGAPAGGGRPKDGEGAPAGGDHSPDGLPEAQDDLSSDGSMSDAEHAKTVLRIRRAAKAEGVDIDTPLPITAKPRPTPTWRLPTPLEGLASAIRTCLKRSDRGILVRARTYARPGRVEGLRGLGRRPEGRVLIAVDVSGSMAISVAQAKTIAKGLRKDAIHADVAVWADEAALLRLHDDTPPSVGGGTRPESLANLPLGQYALVVVVTDGEFRVTEAVKALPRHTVWAITPSGRAPATGHKVIKVRD